MQFVTLMRYLWRGAGIAIRARKKIQAVILLCVASAIVSPAQTFKSLIVFNEKTNGAVPEPPLVQGLDGDFYGTTMSGGSADLGTVFKITPKGTRFLLYDFCRGIGCPDGASPEAGLVLATDGNLYGTTFYGGSTAGKGYGTVFRISPVGVLTTLHSFDLNDGAYPQATLIQAADGNLYGVTFSGLNSGGRFFKITLAGVLTTLHTFDYTDGPDPVGIIQGSDGNFYGTTHGSGTSFGTVFKITSAGVLTTLHSFKGTPQGEFPVAGLVLGTDGDFYGTTIGGGTYGSGTAFKITVTGKLTTLHSFDTTDGVFPFSSLIESAGNVYGATAGAYYDGTYGTTFEMTPTGVLTTLHTFDSLDGQEPSTLVQSTDGSFYGTTYYGGEYGEGTLYILSTGLAPFARTLPTSGTVGESVTILGMNLTGVTTVTFNGIAASFTVVSDTEIATTVPAGATTGKVKISKPGGSLSSNVVFTVIP